MTSKNGASQLDEQVLLDVLSQAAPDGVLVVGADGTILYANSQVEALFGWTVSDLVGEPVEMLLPESVRRAHVGMREGYVRAPSTRPMGTGRDLRARRKDGRTFPVDVSLAPLDTAGGRVVTAFVRDATDTRRRQQQAEATADISRALLESRPVVDVLALTAEYARTVVGADAAWVVTPRDADTLVVRATAGDAAKRLLGVELSLRSSLLGAVMDKAVPALIESLVDDEQVAAEVRALGLGPAFSTPLVASERRFGAMVVARHQDGPMFTDADVASAQVFADSAAVTLAFGEARSELEHERLTAEQERIGRELLNRVINEAYGIGLSLQSVVGIAGRDAGPRIEEAVTRLDQVIRTIRSVVFGIAEPTMQARDDPALFD
jgi:PAS domain S-box-containing protein